MSFLCLCGYLSHFFILFILDFSVLLLFVVLLFQFLLLSVAQQVIIADKPLERQGALEVGGEGGVANPFPNIFILVFKIGDFFRVDGGAFPIKQL